jgi:hypothetical protein
MDEKSIFPPHKPFSSELFYPPVLVVKNHHADISDMHWSGNEHK